MFGYETSGFEWEGIIERHRAQTDIEELIM
jgi:hypothetical protein